MHCVFVRENIQSIILYFPQSTGEHLAGGDYSWLQEKKERNEIWRPFKGLCLSNKAILGLDHVCGSSWWAWCLRLPCLAFDTALWLSHRRLTTWKSVKDIQIPLQSSRGLEVPCSLPFSPPLSVSMWTRERFLLSLHFTEEKCECRELSCFIIVDKVVPRGKYWKGCRCGERLGGGGRPWHQQTTPPRASHTYGVCQRNDNGI